MFADFSLNERLIKAIEALGFEEATKVQAAAIPKAIEGKDLMVCAKTGSGKTAAFVLPLLHRFLENPAPSTGTRALILVPTRELARQVMKQVEAFAQFTGIKAAMVIGGEDFKWQKALMRKNPEFIIATPGRLVEHLDADSISFEDLEALVLDEADRMLDMGFKDDMLRITSLCRPERQTLLFSATLKQRGMEDVVGKALQAPESLIIDTPREKHSQIQQQFVLADDNDHKDKLLASLLDSETFEKALIFTNTKVQATRLAGYLRYKKQKAGVLQGDLDQKQRNNVMMLFRDNAINVLVATDVAARGLDVSGVDIVINYDMARNGDDYVHRIGRTGRTDAEGLAITFITHMDWNLKASVEKYLRTTFEKRTVKGLEGAYKGPKKVKSSGKSAGTKKRNTEKVAEVKKPKVRHKDKKNIGKRRAPAEKKPADATQATAQKTPPAGNLDGFAPPKKRV